jgi:holo-[acyl-carrier protein] synthase
MNISIGIDCEDISRFSRIVDNPRLMNKIFSKEEITYCMKKANPPQHFAARFAGKEAVIKALNNFGKQITLDRIEILNSGSGTPVVNLVGDDLDIFNVMLSLSHSQKTAVASALIIKIDN